ncbi:MAG TPA: PAS domain S-box protein, partial [Thermoleophilia bacterium]
MEASGSIDLLRAQPRRKTLPHGARVRVVLAGAGVVLVIALVGALGWLLGALNLASFRAAYIPMAPATALVLVLLGVGLVVHGLGFGGMRRAQNSTSAGDGLLTRRSSALRAVVGAMALMAVIIGTGVLLRAAGVFHYDFEQVLAGHAGALGGTATGRMSSLTAVLVECAGVALLCLQWPRRPRAVPELTSALTAAVAAISLVVLMGYAYGTPLLYGGTTIPVALPTAAAFLAFSVGLVAALPRASWAVRALSGPQMRARLFRVFLPTTLVLVLLVGWAQSIALNRGPNNPALWMWVLALASTVVVALVVFVVTGRTGDAIDQTERALRESERKLRLISENTSDAIFAYSTDRRLLYVNPAIEELTGYPEEELLRQNTIDWFHPEDKAGALAALEGAFAGQTSGAEFRLLTRSGQMKWCSSSWGPMRDEVGNQIGVQGRKRDITEIKEAEQERLQLERQVQHSQRLESLGVLAGGIAHDFNNLLLGVLGNAELALAELAPAAPARDNLLAITQASQRAAELCRQMLAYSGRGHFVTELIDLRTLVEDMLSLLKSTISKKILLKSNLPEGLSPLRGDASQLSQVVMNLVINASEAIGENSGVITISIGAMECSADYLRTAYLEANLAAGSYLTMEVSDTGSGMDKETQERLFEPFFTTKFTGRGLGLSAVQGIVRGHKGDLKMYSEPGKGTTFKLLFPAAVVEVERLGETSAAEDSSWSGEGTVLLVDDERTIRVLGARMLSRLGFQVLLAADGREALEVYCE